MVGRRPDVLQVHERRDARLLPDAVRAEGRDDVPMLIYIYIYRYMTHVCLFVCLYVRLFVCMHVYVYMYISLTMQLSI